MDNKAVKQQEIIGYLADYITEQLNEGNAVSLPSFGTFGVEKTPEKTVVKNDRKFLEPPRLDVTFTPSLKLIKTIMR